MEKIFEKKDCLVSSTFGMCMVEKVTKLVVGREQQMQYYVLRSLSDKTKKSYIPVEHHETVLRLPMAEEEAKELLNKMVINGNEMQIEGVLTFSMAKEWLELGNPMNWAKASYYYLKKKDQLDSQMKDILQKIWKNLREELAFVLKKTQDDIRQKVENGLQ